MVDNPRYGWVNARGERINRLQWEIDRDSVHINRRLGEGNFGEVYGGDMFLSDSDQIIPVAVKALRPSASEEEQV